ncbi:hypothetical protein GCM10010406_27590 [Streptomyces thermolineatus]|uniref:DUF1877 family protein n=1 Tax=Streptomyces thermolineatus TaxID=44033 RepID=A0ABN3LTC4_9ACTN
MSMIGEYFRVPAAELEKALREPGLALRLVAEAREAEDESQPPPAEARCFSTYKTWALLDFLLQRSGFPVNVVHGEELFTEEDWGYGPPLYLPAERVRLAAEALRRTPYDRLVAGVDHRELAEARVYPQGWDSPESLDWARGRYAELTRFFEAAARDGDALLVWLD